MHISLCLQKDLDLGKLDRLSTSTGPPQESICHGKKSGPRSNGEGEGKQEGDLQSHEAGVSEIVCFFRSPPLTLNAAMHSPVKAQEYNERQNRNRKIRAARQKAEVEALKAALAEASSSNQPAGSAVPALPPPPKDLVEGVLGFEVHHRSPTVAWSNGVKTIVPFIPSRRGVNELEDDAADVIALAQCPVATPDSAPDCIQFFTREEAQSATFVADARAAIAQDKVVVLLGFQPDAAAEFSIEAIESLGLKPALEVEAHGKRASCLGTTFRD